MPGLGRRVSVSTTYRSHVHLVCFKFPLYDSFVEGDRHRASGISEQTRRGPIEAVEGATTGSNRAILSATGGKSRVNRRCPAEVHEPIVDNRHEFGHVGQTPVAVASVTAKAIADPGAFGIRRAGSGFVAIAGGVHLGDV